MTDNIQHVHDHELNVSLMILKRFLIKNMILHEFPILYIVLYLYKSISYVYLLFRYMDYERLGIQVFKLDQYQEAIEALKKGTAAKVVFKIAPGLD